MFAINGFERSTLREIARLAEVDPAMIIRYFGGKDALFARVAMPDLRLHDLGGAGRVAVGEALVRHFLAQWEGEEGGGGLPILLRSAASNEEAAAKLREIFAAQVLPVVAPLGPAGTAPERAGLVASQLLGLALTRYILKLPPVVALPLDTILREVGATVQRYATGGK